MPALISSGTIPTPLTLTPTTVTYRPGLALDLYIPPTPSGACVLVAHGGGFTSTGTNRTNEATTLALCQGLAAIGVIAISIDYTPATGAGLANGQFPRAILDFMCAVRWAYANIRTYGGDPERIGVCGISAGANLAAMTALCMKQGLTTLGNGTSVVEAGAPYTAGPFDTTIVKRWGGYYTPTDLRTYNAIGASPTPTNVLTYLQCSSSADPNYAPRAADASPVVLAHTGVGQPYWLAHGSADIVVYPSYSTAFSASYSTIATGSAHNFDPTSGGANLAANLTMWAGGTGSLFGGL